MPIDGSANLPIGSQRVENVQFTWGVHYNPARRGQVGWGISVELPAVIEMVHLVAQRSVSVEELQGQLLRLAEQIRNAYDEPMPGMDDEPVNSAPWGSDCPVGCAVCAEAKPAFEALRADAVAQRERLKVPDEYPYAAGRRALHRSVCKEAQHAGSLADLGGWDPVGRDTRLLRDFAHHGYQGSNMRVLTIEEAAAWIREHTGPRGGEQYRLCKMCSPKVP
ncbi:hypothetical protein [Kitasatospora sp. NPDC094016]|uniref:hypothetical protein n=1 Tax=Kitasatospora sp. NPDC094016 TaxID=3154986 RepID=UPI003321A96B